MLALAYFVEFIGTFFFLSVIVATSQPILIALALLAVMLVGGGVSGGHFNPATSVMFWLKGGLATQDLAAYVVAQLLGGAGAYYAYTNFLQGMRNTMF
jgi:aquaporin Z